MSCFHDGQPESSTSAIICDTALSSGGRVTGEVKVNGHPQVASTFTRVSGYVEQVGGRRLSLCHSML